MIRLERIYTPWGTLGWMYVEDKKFATMEPPWKNNKQSVSCIPEGIYQLGLRSSPIVKRINGYEEGWEVQEVPNRQYIMFHSGNYAKDSNGCILVGRNMLVHKDNIMVTHSQDAMDEWMELMDTKLLWDIEIKQWVPK